MAAAESEIAAKLIERLLADPAFRDRFRRDPPRACREAGLESLADEMRLGAGKAMHTLDIRESRSSLAGVMMAAAMEGMGVYEFSRHVVPHLEDIPSAVGDVLSRVNMPALPEPGALAGGNGGAPAAAPVPDAEPAAADEPAATEPPPAAAAAPPEETAAKPPEQAAGKEEAISPEEAALAPKEKPASDAGVKEPKEKPASGAKDAAVAPELAGLGDGADAEGATRSDGAELPGEDFEPKPSEGGPKPSSGGDAAPAAPAAPAAAEPAPRSEPIDPSEFGQDGSGGKPDAEALALLKNDNVALDDVGVADVKAGKIDPRIVGVLTKLSEDHKIVVSCMCSDHSKFTTGGSISNHAYGRGLDIASIDGEIVSPGSALAREVSSELSELDPAIRPDEIGSPFAISGPGYFTDAAHSNHIHVGFKQQITPGWKVPAELAAGAQQPAAVAPAAGVAPAGGAVAPELAAVSPVAAPAPDPKRASGLFAAAQAGKVAAAEAAEQPKPGESSQLYLQAVKQAQPAAAGQPPPAPAAEPGAVDLSGVGGGYPGDDAPKEQIAAWMAKQAEKRGLPPQLPVMAALVESNLTNVNYGDADSLGYFQMRASIWESEYPGYADDPNKQVDWFLDTAEAVKDQRVSRGQSITDPSQFGEWIADVERPAEQYRYRYQERLDQANELLKNAPKTTPTPEPEQAPKPEAAEPPAREGPVDVESATKALLGNASVDLPPGARSDLQEGVVDPRLVAVMTELAKDHKIGLSVIKTGHDQFTSGGSVSNHWVGRGIDIATVDGAPVSPGNAAARELVSAIADLDGSLLPTEVGSPWQIGAPGFFTDPAHQDHVHVAFDDEPPADFELPRSAPAAERPAPAGGAVAPELAAVSPVAAPAPDPKRASGLFAAAQAGKVAAAEAAEQPKPGESSQLYLQAVKQAQPAAAGQPPPAPAAEPGAVDLSGVGGGYPGDDAPKEQIAAWMAKQAEKRGLPPQLPVMAALVESNLTNVNYGDADSLGYFQMRASIWESEYPGYADDPNKQVDWFLDTAEAVKDQRVSRGQSITDPSQFGEWIADVERPAEQYRYRYQERLDQANELLKNAPKTTPTPEPEAGTPPAAEADADAPPAVSRGAGPKALAALKEAEKYTGTPYRWGGSTPQTGFDCSGLVQWAYAQAGVQIPRVTHDQIDATNGAAVRRSELLPGDLVFFRDPSGYVYHVGISMGGDKFLHAPRTGDVVKVASLDEAYYNERFTGGRRFDEATAPAPAAAPAAAPEQPAAVDPVAVAAAQAAVARDAAEARRPHSGLFKAISAQEGRNHREPAGSERAPAAAGRSGRVSSERLDENSGLYLKAITAEQAAEAKAAAEAPATPTAPAPPPAAGTPPPPAAGEVPAPPEAAAAEPVPAGPPPDLSAVPADYPGDDASRDELAKWLAKRAEKAGLPPELPVMAAIVESNVRNLNYGHADSVGFFQMRVGIWDKGEYAGYPDNPGLQAKWFIDTALAVKRQEIAAGNANFGKDPRTWGEWIADIERPAEQYRDRYQLRLAEARRLLR